MKPGLSLRVSQHLALTPQLQQSIRLLQLSTLELASEVEQMLEENPFLERDDEAPQQQTEEDARTAAEAGAADDAAASASTDADTTAEHAESDSNGNADSDAGGNDVVNAETDDAYNADAVAAEGQLAEASSIDTESWDGDGSVEISQDGNEWGGEAAARNGSGGSDDDELDVGDRPAPQASLSEHLHRQALALRLSPEDMAVLRFLIESLNDDGYLEDSLAQLAATLTEENDGEEQLEQLVHSFALGLRLLQTFDPAGVGARDLAECLCLQIKALQADEAADSPRRPTLDLALQICQQPGAMELLGKHDIRRLAQTCAAPEADVRQAMQCIARLEPKPGRRFADVERNVIIPDVIVTPIGTGAQTRFRVQINNDVMPRLRVHDIYANALRGGKSGESHQILAQRLQEARWFIKNIQQRFSTILRVSQAIVERQRNFLIHGELAMRPMVQRELADELGVHESTISRVTTAKYMATPRGTFELKYFFGSALGTNAGGNASSTAVRALIKQFISAENAAKPLSDNQIAEMLKKQGIDCARRTVAKYRESMRIPVASQRKAADAAS
ncbi:MAG: RNA polymerase factor sigma-54 [Burkholderiaceae bacterium]|jgi:RNA polymerase sigma-54 factor|nr:RNA polymerase factor sigma-54 [Burkholderiaceae bacterium]